MTSPQDPNEATEPHSFVDFIGSALVALGFVWMALSGLCGASFVLPVVSSPQYWSWMSLLVVGAFIAITGISILFGHSFVKGGRNLKEWARRKRRERK